jgi:hydroxymethylpyrimidine/phosphomethylpyrimidine kinase
LAADLRAFAAAGVLGCPVVAVLTVQSTAGLRSVHPIPAARVVAQAREVVRHQRVRAVKTGALGSAETVRAVARWLASVRCPVVVDPVLLPTRGKGRLLSVAGLDALRQALLPRATLVTANVSEAEVITGGRVANVAEAHDAALAMLRLGARAVLVKGGHLQGGDAVDVLATGHEVIELRASRRPFGRQHGLHGSGCVLASLIAGRLAWEPDRTTGSPVLVRAVRWAKRLHRAAIEGAHDVGGPLRVLVP